MLEAAVKRLAIALLAVTGLVSLGQIASAADLPVKAPVYAPAPAPIFSWTGCYVGGNIGYGWGKHQVTDFITAPGFDIGSDTGTGVVGGGQIGCNYQTSNWVFGAQGMFDGSDVKGSLLPAGAGSAVNPVGFTAHETLGFKTEWLATLTGRIGYLVQPQALVYLKGGAAWAHNTYSDNDPLYIQPYVGHGSATRRGWTIGGGLEYAFLRNWSLFIEYDFIDLGSRNISISYTGSNLITPLYAYDVKQNLQTVLFGVNYKFY